MINLIAKVQSSRDDELWYEVEYLQSRNEWTCGCLDHIYRHRQCKHIKMIKSGIGLTRGTYNLTEEMENFLDWAREKKELERM